ncbi:40S ribosomal protein S25 [Theileria orientalis strain Shintoku]|uniref:40S ribosomal protein S25 n=2 Tax=Theileria orientalis TaxID=68886 RepID=J4D5R9_THEOR|nr:40S ribosomal protein S25 [Theileria orientalis strain Shintoku]PVC52859.1 40S ribosomal protein S25 [Theileria orientalis]UVC54109.1 40S ribosomal protein S25 [Theileria orientalis]BAM39140.1 40S ribosomal protein S25 [Theileria orientalis strain Shintoku]|eukprot:XP_009689441.1 40S ribosomal protein S25 [Theileria orientalis strain Shintoku]
MAIKEKKSKEAVARAAMASGRSKRKKWVKVRARDKLNNAVTFDKTAYDKLMNEIPKSKLITISVVSERLKVNGSLARQALRELESLNLIKPICEPHHTQLLYTKVN